MFANAYCSQPVCTPSRSTVMTGLYPHTTGCIENNVPLRTDQPTIAELISDEYERGYYGKWHLGSELVSQRGFTDWVGIEDGYRAHYADPAERSRLSDYHHELIANGFEPDSLDGELHTFSRQTAAEMPEDFTKARFLGRRAAEFVRRNAGRPWVLYVNFLEPHMPFTGPLNELHDPADLGTGPAFLRKPSEDAALVNQVLADFYGGEQWRDFDLTTESGWREVRRNYWGLVTLVDRATGDILRALEESGQADNTVVVFTSDHGDMMGDHHILAKCVLYEEAVRVPLLLRVPWLSDQRCDVGGRVSLVDLVPTLLDLLGETVPAHVQGQSRVDVLRGDADLGANDVIVEWNGSHNSCTWPDDAPPDAERVDAEPWRTIISHEGWKLNLSAVDQSELYDLNEDPHEQRNLVNDPAQATRIRDLTARVRAWQQRTDDVAALPRI